MRGSKLDEAVLRALDPAVDIAAIRANLDMIPAVCRGGPEQDRSACCRRADASAGWCRPAARSFSRRPSTGRTSDPVASLEHLMDRVVRRPRAETW
jgi:hypothetical protein